MGKISIKTKGEIDIMAEGGHILSEIIKKVKDASQEGVSTWELNNLALQLCDEYKVIPSCKGYKGFPGAFCPCVNDVVVHGIPSRDVILKNGDIFTIDMVIKYKGFHLDSAVTISIGNITQENKEFLETCRLARDIAISKVKEGIQVGDISAIIEYLTVSKGYSPVREMVGHGIGLEMHEAPEIPCFGTPGTGPMLKEGMVIAIESIIAKGKYPVIIGKDGWTARTKDGNIAAVFEHTVAVLKNSYRVLTV